MEELEPQAKNKILIVEDSASNMMLFSDLLERVGYEIVCAETGRQGIRLARSQKPDLILLDIKLPDIDGTKIIRWIRKHDGLRAVPVIAVTAFAMLGDKERFLDAGFDAYVSKPISIPNFLEVIERFVATETIAFGASVAQLDARC